MVSLYLPRWIIYPESRMLDFTYDPLSLQLAWKSDCGIGCGGKIFSSLRV
jgi:hypothetical protein